MDSMRVLDVFTLDPTDLECINSSSQASLRRATAQLVTRHMQNTDSLRLEVTPKGLDALIPGVPAAYRNDRVIPMVESRRTSCLGVSLFIVRACLARSVRSYGGNVHTEAYCLDYSYDPEPDVSIGEQAITLTSGSLAVWSGFTDGRPTAWQEPGEERMTGGYLAQGLAAALKPLASRSTMPDGVSWTMLSPTIPVPALAG